MLPSDPDAFAFSSTLHYRPPSGTYVFDEFSGRTDLDGLLTMLRTANRRPLPPMYARCVR